MADYANVAINDVAALLFGEAEWEYAAVAPRLQRYMDDADEFRANEAAWRKRNANERDSWIETAKLQMEENEGLRAELNQLRTSLAAAEKERDELAAFVAKIHSRLKLAAAIIDEGRPATAKGYLTGTGGLVYEIESKPRADYYLKAGKIVENYSVEHHADCHGETPQNCSCGLKDALEAFRLAKEKLNASDG